MGFFFSTILDSVKPVGKGAGGSCRGFDVISLGFKKEFPAGDFFAPAGNWRIIKLQLINPAHVVLHHAGLHSVEVVIELLGHGANLGIAHANVLSLDAEPADGRNDGSGAGGKDLLEGAVFGGLHDLVNGQLPLTDLHPPALQQLDDGVPGDAGEDGAGVQRGGDDLVGDAEEGIGGADFFHILVFRRVQPQHILAIVLHGVLGGPHGAAVVAAALGKAGAAPGSPDVFILDINPGGGQAAVVGGVVGAGGAEDNHKLIVLGGQHGEGDLVAEDEGPDIKSGARGGGNPVLVLMNHSLDGGQEQVAGEFGDAHPLVGTLHPGDVHVGAEELDAALGIAVGLHTLEHALGIVQHGAGGLDQEGLMGDHPAVVPALALVIVHDKHVVGEILGKAQLGLVGRPGLGMGGSGDRKCVLHCKFLLCVS